MSYDKDEYQKQYSKEKYRKRKELWAKSPELYEEFKKEKRAYWQKYKKISPEKANSKEYRRKDPIRYMVSEVKSRAKKLNQEFNIEVSDITIPDMCPVFNIPLFTTDGKITDNSPSLDRVDNAKGYIKGNIQVISYKANRTKTSMTIENVKSLLNYMIKHTPS